MIVTCERCASQFRLDETKISPQGVRLRCSHCEHAFFVASPQQPDADHARDLARDVLEKAQSAGASRREVDAANRFSGKKSPIESNDTVAPDTAEDDWEFNDDSGAMASPIGGTHALADELAAAREAVDELLGGVPDLSISMPAEEDAASESFLALDLDDGIPSETGESERDLFGETGPSLIDDAELAPSAQFGEDDRANFESIAGLEDEPEFEAAPAGTGADDFDDPANWDLFDSETSSPVAIGAFEPRIGPPSSDSVSAAPIGARRVALSEEQTPGRSKLRGRVVGIAGWMAVVSLLVFGLAGGLSTPNHRTEPWPVESVAAPGFELRGISARWIDNAIVGRLYVISGKLRRSRGSRNVTPLAVQLLDANGRSIDLPIAAIGPKIPERFLRETNPADLVELQNERAAHFAATADSWLSFAAVVPAVPLLAESFEFSPLKPDEGS